MEHIKAFFHKHPIESALLAGVAVIALYFALKPSAASGANNQAAQLQADYFAAEGIQAQSNAAVQVAGINNSGATSRAQIAANTSTTNATTYANLDTAINTSNNNTAVAALPYAAESQLIGALSGVAGQTTSTTSSSSSGGFFGIGAGSNQNTTIAPTDAATHAADYLSTLANGLFAHNGGG